MTNKTVSFNVSFTNDNGEYDGNVHLMSSDGLDVKASGTGASIDDFIESLTDNILDAVVDEKNACNDCKLPNEDNLEEISKEQVMIDSLVEKNNILQERLYMLEERLNALYKGPRKNKSYNSSLNADSDYLAYLLDRMFRY